jgi:pimeloyl-ACP methyl ester carboxylesterase
MTTAGPPLTTSLRHEWQGLACHAEVVGDPGGPHDPILSVHPIGVGLSGAFWNRFSRAWRARGRPEPLVHPDLLGCGRSAMPSRLIDTHDWASQLAGLIDHHLPRPVVLLVQGASLPVALELHALRPERIRGMVLAGPPSWQLMTQDTDPALGRLLWRGFFATPMGTLFYRYARREAFLRSFSIRQLFDRAEDVDAEWLDLLQEGSRDLNSRWAVFSFLAGFWRRDHSARLAALPCPVLAVFGERASGISRSGRQDTPATKAADYGERLPAATARLLPGRNVLPWESTGPFTAAVCDWLEQRRA